MRRHQFRASQTAVRSPNGAADPSTLIYSFDANHNPSRPARSSPLAGSTIAGLPLELLDRLKAVPLFQSAPESFLLDIGKSLRPNVHQPSQEIIREGDDAKAMYWLVRGAVRVTSRDGESTYAELKPGAFFGEIGILMDIPRTASIVASIRSLVVRLNKEDLQKVLPQYPEVEKTIREEALERLAILERKKKEKTVGTSAVDLNVERPAPGPRKRSRDWIAGDVEMGEAGSLADGEVLANKRRKSPSPGIAEIATATGISDPPLTVRSLLKELPLFSGLPSDILHFLGVNAQPMSFPPFVEILKQGTMGRDVYFILKGDVEILTDSEQPSRAHQVGGKSILNGGTPQTIHKVRARLRAGQYFGEVTSLSLAPRRTATVRSVNTVECLLISGEILDDLWRRCGPDLRRQVESEAKRRLSAAKKDDDVLMADTGLEGGPVGGGVSTAPVVHAGGTGADDDDDWRKGLPTVKFDEPPLDDHPSPVQQMEPADPDPFFNPDLDNMRAKSRRSSLAPPLPPAEGQITPLEHRTPSPPATLRLLSSSPLKPGSATSISPSVSPASPARLSPTTTRRPSLVRLPSNFGRGRLPDAILIMVFQHLNLLELMRFRLVSMHWWDLLNSSPDILHDLNLSQYNRHVTDENLRNIIVPFVGNRPKRIDLSNCFHVTDEGFKVLVEACGEGAKMWKMKSVWDVSAPAVLSLVDKAKGLEEIDLSNCRKVGDNLLARVVGWVVPEKPANQPPQQSQPVQQPTNGKRPQSRRGITNGLMTNQTPQEQPPPGTVIGASKLKRLTLSYCKHIQDRSMAHIAVHASERIESLDLTRCTSISDAGFHSWSAYHFKNLRKLVLADCTYLSDQAIVGVVGGCRGLRELDLSFCCALSDTATEVLSLGLPQLRSLNMAFCGSAVSDNSMRCIGLHLLELRYLSVRGCVRVTGHGVESVVEGCRFLEEFDVSQCKNLRRWLEAGGVSKVNAVKEKEGEGRRITFDTVADGNWRVGTR
jgi:F-box and leucine-rich repeat protein 7